MSVAKSGENTGECFLKQRQMMFAMALTWGSIWRGETERERYHCFTLPWQALAGGSLLFPLSIALKPRDE